ncbi:stalk domain-containing protein [Ammoniphilus sp. CFH 90114]|uniref:stalk domain-containing protein n=1 Tax=Ammoniphilus sp. CFH 90114 TaxID=2493665 RepID=UPI00100E7566|nr:stalk domain-containing protein [Ammoniphilus sp. CFH 90114]RXT13514.1 hypothetical protein EIZ39_05010 [Ammoniphilus sp. CFH 90114]
MHFQKWIIFFLLSFWMITPMSVYAQQPNWDVAPYIEIHSKRTMVPIRFISEELGAEVNWNPVSKTVLLDAAEKNIVLTIGSNQATVNGKTHTLDTKPMIRDGRTFVPLRFISESFGAQVEWIGVENKVVVKTNHHTVEMVIKQWEVIGSGRIIGQVDPHSVEIETNKGPNVVQLSHPLMEQSISWKEGAYILYKSYSDEHNRQVMTEIIQMINPTRPYGENERFSKVHVIPYEGKYWVLGLARVFEGVTGYVVEDGHNELVKGHETTSKGAPEWGFFTLNLNVKKIQPNSTLTLILFEESPKDGSRQFELPIVLP